METKENIAFAIYFGVFIFTFFVIMIILFVVVYQRKRVAKENEYYMNLKDKEVQLLNIHIQTQELEREKIARNIHDEIGPLVSALKMHLTKHEMSLIKGALKKEDLVKERKFIDEIMKNIRYILMDLSPQYLLKDGLSVALENYIQGLSSINASMKDQINTTKPIEDNIAINVYRIILELCNNLVKHAKVGTLAIDLVINDDIITAEIKHDGDGLTNQEFLTNMENSTGIGLNSLKARTTLLAASLNFNKGETSMIKLTVPRN